MQIYNLKKKNLNRRSYTIAETLLISKKVKLINCRKFAAMALNKNVKTFVVYIAALLAILIYSIKKAQIELLLANKTATGVPPEYSNYANIFLSNLVMELLKHTGINNYTIKLKED